MDLKDSGWAFVSVPPGQHSLSVGPQPHTIFSKLRERTTECIAPPPHTQTLYPNQTVSRSDQLDELDR